MQKKNNFGLNKYQVLGFALGAVATVGLLNSQCPS